MRATIRERAITVAKAIAGLAGKITVRHFQVALGIATLFGVVAPERATSIRNDILAPLGVAASVGDLL